MVLGDASFGPSSTSPVSPAKDAAHATLSPGKRCQYFVLSPRATDSPRPQDDGIPGDENADHNVPRNLRSAFTPSECTADSGAVTPCVPGAMPRSSSARHLLSPGTSVCSATSDRLSQLAVRNITHRHLSSKELEQKEIEDKRRALKDLMRRNQLSCRRAIETPDACLAGRVSQPSRLRTITVPRAFSLSSTPTPRTPMTPKTRMTEGGSPSECDNSPLLSRTQKLKLLATMTRRPTPTKQGWRPQLTVPKGPELQTSHRSSQILRSLSCPPPEETGVGDIETGQESACSTATRLFRGTSSPMKQRTKETSSEHIKVRRESCQSARLSRPATPEKPKIRVVAAAARAERRVSTVGVLVTSTATPCGSNKEQSAPGGVDAAAGSHCPEQERPPPSAPAHSDGSRGVETPQERAHRARLLTQQRKDEEAKAAQQKLCIFKKAAASPETSRPLVRSPEEFGPSNRTGLRVSTSAPSQLRAGRRPSFGSATARNCLS
mmetsp:Transcript_102571/g.198758  ORF Transcript_102571/g.198758 Transcript_102571/m.198758 type:complete len:493 (-) Transcript_102571:107-1585(-)